MVTGIIDDELVWAAVAAERKSLAELLAGLSREEWERASWCAGWRVRDVVGHVLWTSRVRAGRVLLELARARGNLDRMSFDTAIRYADNHSVETLLSELRASVDIRHAPPGTTALDRLMDLLVHGQDIAVPLGLERVMPVDAARWSVQRVWGTGMPFHAQRKLAGYRLIADDTDWSAGEGVPVVAPIADLLLVVTGRKTVAEVSA